MSSIPRTTTCLIVAALTVSCGTSRPTPDAAKTSTPPDPVSADRDTSVNPGDDFFTYANGGWLKAHPIPPSESSWGIGNEVREEIYTRLRTINENSAKVTAAPGSDEQKIGDFWTTAMDDAKGNQLGLTPLQPLLDRINAIRDVTGAIDVAFLLRPLSVAAFFGVSVDQDEKNSDEMAVHLSQGGLGLPDRDFYLNPEKSIAHIRDEYVAHLGRLLRLLGEDDATAARAATGIMGFETALAKASRPLDALRDPVKNYNKMSPGDVTTRHTPSIQWSNRLDAWHLHTASVIVGQPEFFTAMDGLLQHTPLPVLKDYLRTQLVSAYAPSLSQTFDNENFRFFGQVLSGQKEQRPRWKRVLDAEDAAMGMVLGRLFVQQYFPEAAKRRYSDLVEAIRTAYRGRIDALDWMSDATKEKARQKLAAVTKKVGYPDKWKDYSALVVGRQSYCENLMNAARWRFHDSVSKFGKPVDRTEWDMTPQTYNAYYNPSNNEIVLPAAIFAVPGVADRDLDDAVVFGYAGASTIGHELTHGFDDEGRQFDAKGNLADWWTAEDARKFNARAEVMVKQFDAYEPLPGLHINGKASLGENIADFGGVLLGLDAFKTTAQYKAGKSIDGLTPMQRYFLGYALGWLSEEQDAHLRSALLSDVHAPAKWRVLGPLANMPEFYDAFGVKPGQAMWRAPDERVAIW
ncbi:MAG TPA: M13 family metallopeptidase [Vicinamibacterales bacterium]